MMGRMRTRSFSHPARALVSILLAVACLCSTLQPAQAQLEVNDDAAIRSAVMDAVNAHREDVLGFVIFDVTIDHLDIAATGDLALVWLSYSDRDTGQVIASEPGLAIAQRSTGAPHGWKVTLQADADFETALTEIPPALLPAEQRPGLVPSTPESEAAASSVYTGYRLPWEKGKGVYITGSIGHFLIYKSCSLESCRYAYDFADGSMFALRASRAGTVKYAYWNCANGSENCSNYLVLEDRTTYPTTYQLYLHLAYNSIPAALRQPGAKVYRNQYIGNADDTGYSSGHHLHFMVHTNPYSYWGNSVDIRFDEVKINNGQPRTKYEATQFPQYGSQYVEGNLLVSDNGPEEEITPFGGLISPISHHIIEDSDLIVSGWGGGALKVAGMQVMANYDGVWKPIGASQSVSPFTTVINVCNSGIPNGPFRLGLVITDVLGNQSPVQSEINVVNNANCPEPVKICHPASNQVALYANTNYIGASTRCRLYNVGEYPDLKDLGDDDAESIWVGSKVRAILFDGQNYTGRAETLTGSDPNLADNRLNAGKPSSLRVEYQTTPPRTPAPSFPGFDLRRNPSQLDSLTLRWDNQDGGQEYSSTLQRADGSLLTLPWGTSTFWPVGNLPPGEYTWMVYARNPGGTSQAGIIFQVLEEAFPAVELPLPAPLGAEFETGSQDWIASGLWRLAPLTLAGRSSTVWITNEEATGTYNNPEIQGGDLTSPPILLGETPQVLRFSTFRSSEFTEVYGRYFQLSNPDWDQRRVQISVEDGPFIDLYPLSDDPPDIWLESPAIDLSAFAGKQVRLRFHFETLDGHYNNYTGWAVDSVRIDSALPEDCQETQPDDVPEAAGLIEPGKPVSGIICPGGDIDYYRFSARAGQHISASLDAASLGSPLNAILSLVDQDGRNILMDNNDRAAGNPDPAFHFFIPRDGVYYFKVKAWDHPSAGGSEYAYALRFDWDTQPGLRWMYPTSPVVPGTQPFEARVQAWDAETRVERVDWYYHGADWSQTLWTFLGSDANGADGWSWTVDPVALSMQEGAALLAKAYDRPESETNFALTTVSSLVFWDLQPDTRAPVTHVKPLPAVSEVNAIHLDWVVDQGGDLERFILSVQVDGGEWSLLGNHIPARQRSYDLVVDAGHTYAFCLQGVDAFGLEEACPSVPDAVTSVPAACSMDAYEAGGDDDPLGASLLALNGVQGHNICAGGDVDWTTFQAEAGKTTHVVLEAPNPMMRMQMELFTAADWGMPLQTAVAPGNGSAVGIIVRPMETTQYFVRVAPFDDRLFGNGSGYTVQLRPGTGFFLPLIRYFP